MPKRELTTKDRVDILLIEGVDRPKKWAIVHTYVEPSHLCDDCPTDWRNEWQRLRDHHLEETNFFLDVIRELASRVRVICPQCETAMTKTEGCYFCTRCGHSKG